MDQNVGQSDLYREAIADFGAGLDRLARGYEADPERRRDLVQDIHVALWRSFDGFDGRCSVRTWVYRVAHNTATSHLRRERRANAPRFVGIEALAEVAHGGDQEASVDRRLALERLTALIRLLDPLDRQVILAYLEGLNAASIGEITGLSAGYTATKIHRIKSLLAHLFHNGAHNG